MFLRRYNTIRRNRIPLAVVVNVDGILVLLLFNLSAYIFGFCQVTYKHTTIKKYIDDLVTVT